MTEQKHPAHTRKNPHCHHCGSPKTESKGTRNGKNRYWCTGCHKYFVVDHTHHDGPLWVRYMDGAPFRKLATEINLSPTQTYRKVFTELERLPDNTYLTSQYCNRYSGILILDGKYVKVRGYEQKIPFIYAIDYLTHDIPVGILAPSENDESLRKLFRLLKTCNYPLNVVVGDDRISLNRAVFYYYPNAKIQQCQNHYVENIRRLLNVRTDKKYQKFFNSLYKHVFFERHRDKYLDDALHHLLTNRSNNDIVLQQIIMDIYRRRDHLFAYQKIPNCPKDTNLIELYNSHLNARLRSIKGFKSFQHAETWLNGYMLWRRFKNLTDCDVRFKKLNGHCSFEMALKKQAVLPVIPGLEFAPERKRLAYRPSRRARSLP